MAQFYSGKDGVFLLSGDKSDAGYFNANNAKVVDWSLSTSVDVLETTTLRDKAKTYIPGIQEATGSANLLFYADGGTSLIYNILNGVTAKKDGTYDTERRFMRLALERGIMVKFACYITSCELSVSAGDVAKASIQFTVDGAIQEIKLNPTAADLPSL
jgi:hypothetical protein